MTATPATPAQIAYATKLRDDMATYATFPITEATLYGCTRDKIAILGYADLASFFAAVPDIEQRRAMTRSITAEQIAADAQQRAEELRAKQAELGKTDIKHMSRQQISAYIDAVKSL